MEGALIALALMALLILALFVLSFYTAQYATRRRLDGYNIDWLLWYGGFVDGLTIVAIIVAATIAWRL